MKAAILCREECSCGCSTEIRVCDFDDEVEVCIKDIKWRLRDYGYGPIGIKAYLHNRIWKASKDIVSILLNRPISVSVVVSKELWNKIPKEARDEV